MRFVLLLCAVLLGLSGAAALADPAEPGWVQPVAPLPAAADGLRAAATDGVLYLLVEDHFAWQDDGQRAHYARRALQVLDRAGLEAAASVDWDYAPAFDRLRLTRLQIRRGETVIDLTGRLQPEILRRETRLESGILDGSLTAHYLLPDLRVGDIVDYSFLITETPILPGATFAGEVGLEFGSPVALTRVVLNWPDDRPLTLGPLPERVAHSVTTRPGLTIHEWRRSGHVPPAPEPLVPVEDDPDAAVRYSSASDWGPLVATLWPIYADPGPLPDNWLAKAEAIRRDHPDDLSRATAALRLVQDDIRYVGIEIGPGGIVPRPPRQVVGQGFGDCKDKSVLLRALLARLGIPAQVALADLDRGYALPLALPWLGAFNHMIVRAEIGGRIYWMDPTGSHEGGRLDRAAVPDYGYALPVAPGVTALEAIPLGDRSGWITETTETFRFGILGVDLTVTTHFSGASANAQRYRFASEAATRIGEGLTQFYAARYPGIRQVSPPSSEDDVLNNVLTTREHYVLPAPELFANDLWGNFITAAEDFGGYYPTGLTGTRRLPMTIGTPKRHHHTVLIENAPVSFQRPERISLRNPAFTYRFAGRVDREGALRLDWDFRTLSRVIAPADVAQVIRDARRIGDTSSLIWDLRP